MVEKSHTYLYTHSPDLYEKVMTSIDAYRLKSAIRGAYMNSVAFLVSLIGLVYASVYLYVGMTANGFTEFMSLIVSDTGYAFSYIGDYVSSLVESFPITESAMFLLAGLACSYFIFNIITNIKTIKYEHRTRTA